MREDKLRNGMLRFNPDSDRWNFEIGNKQESLHCGETVYIRMGKPAQYLYGRIETDGKREGYFIFAGEDQTAFTLRKGSQYPARMH